MDEPLIVVPLDGSDFSGAALPYARIVAKARKGRLLLIAAWGGANGELLDALRGMPGDLTEQVEHYYQDYLNRIAEPLRSDFSVETRVSVGYSVDEILRVIREGQASMLVLTSHGHSGLSRWLYGSVANLLVRLAPVPTLVVGPQVLQRPEPAPTVRRILVPLDGSPLAEAALAPALELGEALDATVTIAEAVRPSRERFPFSISDHEAQEIDRQLTGRAQHYLQRVQQGLPAERAVQARVLRGAPSDALLDFIASERFDLVAMATHARGWPTRTVLGSVADRIVQGSAPVLLVRPDVK